MTNVDGQRLGTSAVPDRRPEARRALACALAVSLAPAAIAGDWKVEPFAIKNKQAGFEAKLTGYVQSDFRSFRWDVEDPAFRNDTADIRRIRTGVQGKWKDLSFEFDLDWTGRARDLTNDNEPPYAPAEVKDALVEYEFAKAFSLRAGAFKVPVGYEFLTSAGKTDFAERSLLANALTPDRDFGVMALGELGKKLRYQLGVFAGDGRTSHTRAETTAAARILWNPWKPLDVAGSFSLGDVKADPDGPGTNPEPKGVRGESPSGWRFYERKFVDGQRLRWGVDSQYTRGGFQLKGEFLQAREQRKRQGSTFQDLPDEVGSGWAFAASWIVTGEKKERTLKPKRPITKGGPGLVELAARYESLRFNDSDDAGFEGAGNRARNLRPAQDRILWGAVSWFPTGWMRVSGNVYMERYLDPLLAPEPPGARFLSGTPRERGNYVTLVARVQFLFP